VFRTISDIRGYIEAVKAGISAVQETLNLVLNIAYQYISEITGVINYVANFDTAIDQYISKLDQFEKKTAALFSEIENEKQSSLESGISKAEFPEKELDNARTEILNIKTATNELVQSMTLNGYLEKEFSWDDDTTRLIDDIVLNQYDLEENFMPIVQIAKSSASNEPIASIVINGVVTPVYGYRIYSAKSNTTLERVALSAMGDPDYKDIISVVNDIYADDEIVSGMKLKIPVLQPDVRLTTNEVYNTLAEQNDQIGRDIEIDSNGDIVMDPSGDYALTSGEDTLNQAIYMRLSEQQNRQVRNPDYGTLLTIGEALGGEAPVEYIATSIKETLLQDPRILSVFNTKISANGDSITVSFNYTTIENVVSEYREGF
jgi:hypothetical protein